MKAHVQKHRLVFKKPGGTSRGVLHHKDTYFLTLTDGVHWGVGECGVFEGLSPENMAHYPDHLDWVCQNIDRGLASLLAASEAFPSIQMGMETAFRSIHGEDSFAIFPSLFSSGADKIAINGLIWMGPIETMSQQIEQRLEEGFDCIKLKIGALDFAAELALIKGLRSRFSASEITIRVDANGAYTDDAPLEKLKRLSELDLHSIEQPIAQGHWDQMAELCERTDLPIALDEELIGIIGLDQKRKMLQTIKPQYIILKPSLIGGFSASDQWIELAQSQDIGWWVTSALESNIGLNAIAQYTYTKQALGPQGLGTGSLFANNIDAPLRVEKGYLSYDTHADWSLQHLNIPTCL